MPVKDEGIHVMHIAMYSSFLSLPASTGTAHFMCTHRAPTEGPMASVSSDLVLVEKGTALLSGD